ncbi:helix-turn-helix domain-containing protein [Heyndrickxia ginsengihumi]|uniref:helix-turn-helix domain-containing protein n=1 Tax=Heyndrickxia ginsengihumi TaxID=363870 RepID=UPI0020422976|nr:helix-turn-helix domain-containing protein [Heyndrickxia ginsengihumi]MCM3024059.1 helix-turn-helix domain containing protein [Heyndrickxia ginsengihumi]
MLRKKSPTTYPVQFKFDVLKYKLRTGESFESVAIKFGIHEPPMIANWMRLWKKEGIEGFSKLKGRPSMSNKQKKKTSAKKLTKEQQLEK